MVLGPHVALDALPVGAPAGVDVLAGLDGRRLLDMLKTVAFAKATLFASGATVSHCASQRGGCPLSRESLTMSKIPRKAPSTCHFFFTPTWQPAHAHKQIKATCR
jgi:hypothetical protein